MLRMILTRGWYPALITALAVIGIIYGWSINVLVPILIVILFGGLIAAIIMARKKIICQAYLFFSLRECGNRWRNAR